MHTNTLQTTSRSDAPDHGQLQAFLDRVFPQGALCALIPTDRGGIDAAKSYATGRLVCDRSERSEDGVWYRVTIDPRRSAAEKPEVLQLWTREPQRCSNSKHLWEAAVRTEDGTTSILRLNASPPQPWRPSAAMRQAVTERYAGYLATSDRSL